MTSQTEFRGLLYRPNGSGHPQLSTTTIITRPRPQRTQHHRRWPASVHIRHRSNVLTCATLVMLILVFETLTISLASCQIHSGKFRANFASSPYLFTPVLSLACSSCLFLILSSKIALSVCASSFFSHILPFICQRSFVCLCVACVWPI